MSTAGRCDRSIADLNGEVAPMATAVLPWAPDDLPCRTHDPELWFAETPRELELAKALCTDCPVLAACLHGALSRREPWGVWGGEIFDRGRIVGRKRPRGRPRKLVPAVATRLPRGLRDHVNRTDTAAAAVFR
jgi:WhiB family redox-sensing transcriptional regulator